MKKTIFLITSVVIVGVLYLNHDGAYNTVYFSAGDGELKPLNHLEVALLINDAYKNATKNKRLGNSAKVLFTRACILTETKKASLSLFKYTDESPFTEGITPHYNSISVADTYEQKPSFDIYLDMLSNLCMLKNLRAGQRQITREQQFLAELQGLEILGQELGEESFKKLLKSHFNKELVSIYWLKKIADEKLGISALMDQFSKHHADKGGLAAHVYYIVRPEALIIAGPEKYDDLKQIIGEVTGLSGKTKNLTQAKLEFEQHFTEERINEAFKDK